MGHERIPSLPKSIKWRNLVAYMAESSPQEDTINEIASQTIRYINSRYSNLHNDESVIAAIKFFIRLSISGNKIDRIAYLNQHGIIINGEISVTKLAKAFKLWTQNNPFNSQEYNTIVEYASIDTISIWFDSHKSSQQELYLYKDKNLDILKHAKNGAGFCELARLLFANFTSRYMRYFLEREASHSFKTLKERNQFTLNLENHIEIVTKHAFETSQIAQSFAAGWFNKYAKEKMPDDPKIISFLWKCFGKIRDELSIEVDST